MQARRLACARQTTAALMVPKEYDRNDSTLLFPNGYLQSEEFRKIQSQSINKYLNENILELKKNRNDSLTNNNLNNDNEGASKLVFENQHHDELNELFDNFKKINLRKFD